MVGVPKFSLLLDQKLLQC